MITATGGPNAGLTTGFALTLTGLIFAGLGWGTGG